MPNEFITPEPVPVMQEPPFGEWPSWVETNGAGRWRNGREAGAYLAGCIACSPEKCGLVTVPNDWADGAALALLVAGVSVEAYSSSEATVTYRCRASWYPWTTRVE